MIAPGGLRLKPHVVLALMALVFLTLFLGWSAAVFTILRIAEFDLEVARRFALRATDSYWTRGLMVFATICGGIRANVVLALLGAFWMWRHHRRRFAIGWLIIALGGGLLVMETKDLFNRERPPHDLRDRAVTETNESYPSGHATGSAIGYGMVGFVLLQFVKSWPKRIAITLALVNWVVLIGFSRVYLRAHWASDIVGGWLLAMTYLNASLAIYFWRRNPIAMMGTTKAPNPNEGSSTDSQTSD